MRSRRAHSDLALPTANNALYTGEYEKFYQFVERDFQGVKSTPWEGGQYGFVRDPVETAGGNCIYTVSRGYRHQAVAKGRHRHAARPGDGDWGRHGRPRERHGLLFQLRQIHRHRSSLGRLPLLQPLRASASPSSTRASMSRRDGKSACSDFTGEGIDLRRAQMSILRST